MLQKKENDLFQVAEILNRVEGEISEYRNDAAVEQIIHNAHK